MLLEASPPTSIETRADEGRREAWGPAGEHVELARRTLAFRALATPLEAMTLLIVTVDAPEPPVADLTAKVRALSPEIFSFAVIGRYCLAHHRFFGLLQAISGSLLRWNLLYLALVAFLPWPTALVGDFPTSTLAVVSYAVCAGAVNAIETRMYAVAIKESLLKRSLPKDVERFWLRSSLIPVLAFTLSIPVALWDTRTAIVLWLLVLGPAQVLVGRFRPPRTDDFWR
jgi:uncharacterized membrane protein